MFLKFRKLQNSNKGYLLTGDLEYLKNLQTPSNNLLILNKKMKLGKS